MSGNFMDLDPNSTVLLVVDLQQALFERSSPIYRANELLETISDLVARAHTAGVLVVYIRHCNKMLAPGSTGWRLHPTLRPAAGDLLIEKKHGDAFQDTPLGAELKARSVTTVLVTGLVTHGCVRATCLGGAERGYTVILVADAHSSYSRDAVRLIEAWNEKLSKSIAGVLPAANLDFGGIPAG
jgi:nicotinamidase-related amidase